jgi:glycosyltransferase involved in cell wall biosynthesis
LVPEDLAVRVLHVPDAVGGQAAGLARAERELGLDSRAIGLEPSPFGYAMDEVLRESHPSRVGFELARLRLVLRAAREFDVVHFNFGRTILPSPARGAADLRSRLYGALLGLRDLPFLARAGKAIVVTFQGDDARQGDVLRRLYENSVAAANPANYTVGDRAKRSIIATFDRYADAIFFLNPDLGHVLPVRAEFLPYASVDLRDWRPTPLRASGRPLVVHAPSDRLTKGTDTVLEVVDRLQREGLQFEFRLVEGVAQAEARAIYEHADVFIDQLHVGWYGAAAVEAMALAKPVLCFLRTEDFAFLPAGLADAIPIVSVTPATLSERLRELVTADVGRRTELGATGRAFVEHWHDPLAIAERLRAVYAAAVASKANRR